MTKYYTGGPAVYGLVGPDGRVFYVGRTSRSTRARMYEHRYRMSWHPGPVYERWRELGKDAVSIVVLDSDASEEVETRWIVRLQSEGHPLVNQLSTDGTPGSMSKGSKEKISHGNKGRKTWIAGKKGEAAGWTPERRAAQSKRIKEINRRRAADS